MVKNKLGISLVALIITVIVLIILAGAVALVGADTPEQAQLAVFYNNVSTIQEAVRLKMNSNIIKYFKVDYNNSRWVGVVDGYTVDSLTNRIEPEFNDLAINGKNVSKIDKSVKQNVRISDEEFDNYYVDDDGIVYHSGLAFNNVVYYNNTLNTSQGNIFVNIQPNGGHVTNGTIPVVLTVNSQYALDSNNEYQYCLTNSRTLTGNETWNTYTSGTQFNIGSGLSGTYYIHIKDIYDVEGNKTTNIISNAFMFNTQKTFLYANGDTCNALTGGWSNYTVPGVSGHSTITNSNTVQRQAVFNASNIYLSTGYVNYNMTTSTIKTNNMIDLTNYSKMYVKCYVQGMVPWLVGSVKTDLNFVYTMVDQPQNNPSAIMGIRGDPYDGDNIVEMDLSDVTGNHYVFVQALGWQWGVGWQGPFDTDATIYEIWLE